MTYAVKEEYIKYKLIYCVKVCSVDCFYKSRNMLVIKTDECIDCGIWETQRLIDTIKLDTELCLEKWIEINYKYAKKKKIK